MDNYLFLPRAIVSAVYNLAFATAVGLLFSRLWLGRDTINTPHHTVRRLLIACSSALFLVLGAQVVLTTAMMTGTLNGVTSQIKDVLVSTHAGRLLIPALLLSAGLTALARIKRPLTVTSLAILFAMAIIRAGTGHAASQGEFTLPEVMQLLHLSSTAIWAGSVMIAGLFVVPELSRTSDTVTLLRFSKRLSATATIAVALVILSGIYNAWLDLSGTLPPLVHTQWGILLTIKSSLVSIAVLLGLYNRILLRSPDFPFSMHRFARSLRFEALLIATILTLSAFLANSPPATS
jgi:putative copper resistance protein D